MFQSCPPHDSPIRLQPVRHRNDGLAPRSWNYHLTPHSYLLTLHPSLLQSAALDGQQVDGTPMLDPQAHLIDREKLLLYIFDYLGSSWEPVTSSH
jgi:hypothetical protein